MTSLKEYEKQNNAKITRHRDGTVTVKFKRRRQSANFNDFNDKNLSIIRGFKRRLDMEYIPSNKTYNWGQYKETGTVKIVARFQ